MGALLDALNEDGLAVAQRYARAGLPVFPCNPLNKRPLTEHGHLEASTEVMKIRGWWAKWPQAMVGMPTGSRSGLFVLDVDQDPTRDKYGVQSLADAGHDIAELMDTATAQSASGGFHFFFKFDPAKPVSNARGKLPKWIDVRGEGGYVVMAGSKTSDGRYYAWLNPIDESPAEAAPDWLMELLRGSADPLDFNSAVRVKAPAERVAAIAPGTWHENTRDIVARMVREGASDETVAAIAARFVEPGFTVDQTVREFLTHARTARDKWGYQPKDLSAATEPLPPSDDGTPQFRFNLTYFDDIPEEHHKTWLVRDIFGSNEFSIVYGAPGSGKSVLMGDAAAHVAAGLPWFGRKTEACAVLYVAAERHTLVKRRMAAWRKHHGILNLPLIVLDGLFNFATDTSHGDEILRIAEHVFEKTGVRVGWVIIDTKAQVMGGADENASKDTSILNNNIARIQRIPAHVTIVDHTPQADPTRMKGNGGLAGAADGSFLVQKQGQIRTFDVGSKAPNDGPDTINIVFALQGVLLGVNADGEKTEAPVVLEADPTAQQQNEPKPAQHRGPLQEKIMTAVGQAARDGQTLGFTRLSTMTGAKDGALGIAIRKLCDKGELIEVPNDKGGRFWTLP